MKINDLEKIDFVDMQKTIDPEKVIDVLDFCLDQISQVREKIRQELYYDEL